MPESVTISDHRATKNPSTQINGYKIGLHPYSFGITSPFDILAGLCYSCQHPILIITAIVQTIQTILIFLKELIWCKFGTSKKGREMCLGSDLLRKILSYGDSAKIVKSAQVKLFKYIPQVP